MADGFHSISVVPRYDFLKASFWQHLKVPPYNAGEDKSFLEAGHKVCCILSI